MFDRWEEVGLTEEQEMETMPAGPRGSVSVNVASSDPAGADLLTSSEESPSPVRSTTAGRRALRISLGDGSPSSDSSSCWLLSALQLKKLCYRR